MEAVSSRGDHPYPDARLGHVVLKNVELKQCPACKDSGVSFERSSGLAVALANSFVRQTRFLTSGEVAFLIRWLDWPIEKFSACMGLSTQFIHVWMTVGAHPELSTLVPADRLLRLVVTHTLGEMLDPMMLASIEPHSEVRSTLEASFDGDFWSVEERHKGPLALAAERRPPDFESLPVEERWRIDKALGILDWDGHANT